MTGTPHPLSRFSGILAASALCALLSAVPFMPVHAQTASRTTAPPIYMVSPSDGAAVSGRTTLAATSQQGVTGLKFRIMQSGQTMAEVAGTVDTAGTGWTAVWDSATLPNGSYGILAFGLDSARVSVESAQVLFMVDNQTTSGQVNMDSISNINSISNVIPTPPTLSMVLPESGSIIAGTSQLSATATGTVTGVMFRILSQATEITQVAADMGETRGTWIKDWDSMTVGNGAYDIMALGVDGSDNPIESAFITFTVQNEVAATLTITAPQAGATLSDVVTLSGTSTGTLTDIRFKVFSSAGAAVADLPATAGTSTATRAGDTWTASWDTKSSATPNGSYIIRLVGLDAQRNTVSSPNVSVTVQNQTTAAPTLTITAPQAGATLSDVVTLSGTSTGTLTDIRFKVFSSAGAAVADLPATAGTSTATAAGGAWTASWDTKSSATPNGSYIIRLVGLDAQRNTVSSPNVSVTVQNEVAATLTITAPQGGATVGNVVTLTGSSTGTLTDIRFKVFSSAGAAVADLPATAGTSTATAAGGAWTASWDTTGSRTPNGSYIIRLEGLDAQRNTVASPNVSVTVQNEVAAPTVSFTAPGAGSTLIGTVTISATSSAKLDDLTFFIESDSTTSTTVTSPVQVQATGSSDGMRWEASWNSETASNGAYRIVARSDKYGTAVLGGPRNVSVGNTSISVQVIAPTNGAVLVGKVALSLVARPDVDSALFGIRLGTEDVARIAAKFTSGSSTWNAELDSTTLDDGQYLLYGEATRGGNAYKSSGLNVKIQNGPNIPPPTEEKVSVRVIAPEAGATLTGQIRLAANAPEDASGLDFFISGLDDTTFLRKVGGVRASGASEWTAGFQTGDVPNGRYGIAAVARWSGGKEAASPRVDVAFRNETTTTEPPVTETQPEVQVRLISPSGGQVRGVIQLSATAEGSVNAVVFIARQSGAERLRVQGALKDREWRATIDTTKLPDGAYGLVAVANPAAGPVPSDVVDIVVRNTATTVEPLPIVPETTEPKTGETTEPTRIVAGPLAISIVAPPGGATVRGIVSLNAKTGASATRVVFLQRKRNDAQWNFLRAAAFVPATGTWGTLWDTAGISAGDYQVIAVGWRRAAGVTTEVPNDAWKTIVASGTSGAPAGIEAAGFSPLIDVRVDNITKSEGETVTVVDTEVVKAVVQEVPTGTVPVMEKVVTAMQPSVLSPEVKEAVAQKVNAECVEKGIAPEKCQEWLAARHQAPECKAYGIVTKEECLAFLKSRNQGQVPGCQGKSAEACAEVEERATAGLMSGDKFAKVEEQAIKQINKVIRIEVEAPKAEGGKTEVKAVPVDAPQEDVGQELKETIPLKPKPQQRLAVRVHASPSYAKVTEDASVKKVPAVLLIDTDADGLPDDIEKRLGTDPTNPDSDGDGYSDFTEVKNGYDPLGPGKLGEGKELAPVEKAIVAGLPIEQPSEAGAVDESLTVEQATTKPKEEGAGKAEGEAAPAAPAEEEPVLHLGGKGKPGEMITIFVYSYLPVVLTTTVNDDGNWSYDLDAGLNEGEHQAYVTVTDDTGKIKSKSNPLAFFVGEAQAVTSEADFFQVDTAELAQEPVSRLFWMYAIGAGVLIVAAIMLGFFIFMKPKRRDDDGGFMMS